ncbi:MAG: VanW family protein [Actinomycetota bacterium]
MDPDSEGPYPNVSATLKYEEIADDPKSDRRILYFVLVGIAMVPIIVYLAAVLVTWGKLPRGTYVAGVDVGGRTSAQAKKLLRDALEPQIKAPVPIKAAEVTASIDPTTAGLSIDYDKTVDGLAASSMNPVTVARSFSGRTDHEPQLVVDDAAIDKTVAAFAKKVDKPAREGSVRFDGTKPVAVMPLVGRTLDRAFAAKSLHDRFAALKTDPVEVPVQRIDVLTSQDKVDAAITKIATPAVSGPLRMVADGRGIELSADDIGSFISLKTDANGAINLVVDSDKVRALVLPQLPSYDAPSKDGSIDVVNGAVRITPSINGRTADVDGLIAAVPAALAKSAPREIPIPFLAVEPKITTEKIKALGIKEVVSSFTTHHPCCAARVNNIHTIAKIVDGALVMPGDTFSLNGYVGERDKGRGFIEAPMILKGVLTPAVGGGVSQFATTMFNAVFFGGFKDVYHKTHSFYISRYPAGREATVSSPAPDLKWTNDSPYGVLVKTSFTGTTITVTFYSTKQYDRIDSISGPRTRPTPTMVVYLPPGPQCVKAAGSPGFDIVVWRAFIKGGKEVKPRERFYTRYVPEPIFICAVPPVVPPGSSPPPPGSSVSPPAPSPSPSAPAPKPTTAN